MGVAWNGSGARAPMRLISPQIGQFAGQRQRIGPASRLAPPRQRLGSTIPEDPRHGRHGPLSRSRRLHLVRRQARALARGQPARAEPRPALCERGVRGRAGLRRRDLRADPAQPAALRGRQDAGLHHPLQRRRDRPGLPRDGQGQQAHRLLRAPDRLARQRDDGRLGAGDQDPPGHLRLGLGLLLPDGAAAQGHPPHHRPVSPARSRHRARQDQGRRPLHDLHAREAPRRAHGLLPTR